MKLRRLFAREYCLYGTARQISGQRRLRLDRELFLGAKGAATRRQLHGNLFKWQVQNSGNLALIEIEP